MALRATCEALKVCVVAVATPICWLIAKIGTGLKYCGGRIIGCMNEGRSLLYACVSAICTALRAGVVKTKTTLYTFVFSPIVSLLCVRFRSTRLHAFGHMLPHLNRYIRSCSDPFAVHLTARQPV